MGQNQSCAASGCSPQVLAIARGLGGFFLRAAGEPGWLPEEREAITAAAAAISRARDVLQRDLDQPVVRRRRAVQAAVPGDGTGSAVSMDQAAAMLGVSRSTIRKRVERLGVGLRVRPGGEIRLSVIDLEALRTDGLALSGLQRQIRPSGAPGQ